MQLEHHRLAAVFTECVLPFQLNLLRQAGFRQVEVLHKNVCFAAFGALKG